MEWFYSLLALLIIVLSVFLIFRFIGWLAVFLRYRNVKGKKIPVVPKIQKVLINQNCAVLYFTSPIAEKTRSKMSNVIKIISEEYKNVIRFDITKDKQDAERYNVISAPTTIILSKDGTVCEYFVGFKPYPKVKRMIEKVLLKSIQTPKK